MNKKKFVNLRKQFKKTRILCIGDLILDTFVQGVVNRISPEAPVPILLSKNTTTEVGGAGNVARNISSLGGKVGFLSLIGKDENIIVNKSKILDSFDLCRNNDIFQIKVYGIKVAFHNELEKKTLIVSGIVDDLLISCIDNDYINNIHETLIKESQHLQFFLLQLEIFYVVYHSLL